MEIKKENLTELNDIDLEEVAGGTGASSGKQVTITGDYVRFRRTKDSSDLSNVICQLRKGTVVTLVNRGTYWCRIIYKGQEGFVGSDYVSA